MEQLGDPNQRFDKTILITTSERVLQVGATSSAILIDYSTVEMCFSCRGLCHFSYVN